MKSWLPHSRKKTNQESRVTETAPAPRPVVMSLRIHDVERGRRLGQGRSLSSFERDHYLQNELQSLTLGASASPHVGGNKNSDEQPLAITKQPYTHRSVSVRLVFNIVLNAINVNMQNRARWPYSVRGGAIARGYTRT